MRFSLCKISNDSFFQLLNIARLPQIDHSLIMQSNRPMKIRIGLAGPFIPTTIQCGIQAPKVLLHYITPYGYLQRLVSISQSL